MTSSISTFRILNNKVLGMVGWLCLCFATASLGALFVPGDWYASLQKPSWNPPSWVFAPVWSILYTLMAVAAWLVWQCRGFPNQGKALTLFLLQLALNAVWTPLFFGLKNPGIAFVEIILLWFAIAATIVSFHAINRVAARLLLPYLGWVSFAAALNFVLWRLNLGTTHP